MSNARGEFQRQQNGMHFGGYLPDGCIWPSDADYHDAMNGPWDEREPDEDEDEGPDEPEPEAA